MKRYFLFCVFTYSLFSFISCNRTNNKDNASCISFTECEKIVIPDLKDSSLIFYSDFCSDVEYIPLELTDRSVIGYIDKVSVTNDGSFIIFDKRNDQLLRFDSQGHFANTIGRKGRQSNEFSNINDFAYNPYNDQIIVWDNPTHSLLFYTLQGHYINRIEIDWWSGELAVIDEDHLAFYVSKLENHCAHYKFIITRSDVQTVEHEMEMPVPVVPRATVSFGQFDHIYDGVCFNGQYSSKVYNLTQNGIHPLFNLDFGDNDIPLNWFDLGEKEYFRKLRNNRNVSYCHHILYDDNYILMSIVQNSIHLMVVERNGQKRSISGSVALNNIYDKQILPDEFSVEGGVVPMAIHENCCYFVIEPDEEKSISDKTINEMIDKHGAKISKTISEQVHYQIDNYNNLMLNSNPILVKCTLK